MTPKPAEVSGVSEIYELLRFAAARRQPVAARVDCSRRTGAAGVRPGDFLRAAGIGGLEVYGLRNGDLFQEGAIRVERSWYRGDLNPTKTNQIREGAWEQRFSIG